MERENISDGKVIVGSIDGDADVLNFCIVVFSVEDLQ